MIENQKTYPSRMAMVAIALIFGVMSFTITVDAKKKTKTFEMCCEKQIEKGKSASDATKRCSKARKMWRKKVCAEPAPAVEEAAEDADFSDLDAEDADPM